MGDWSPCWAVAGATHRELRRRPGLLLALLAAGCLLAFLQRLSATVLGSSTGLTIELSLATASLFLSLVAGVAGVRAAADGDELGTNALILAAPVSRGGYLVGRLLGILSWAAWALVLLAAFATVGHLLAGASGAVPTLAALALAGTGILAQAALLAALGMACAALCPPPLATLLVLAFLVGSRLLIPELASGDDSGRWVALLLPDPLRLDFARDVGFARPLSFGSAGLALTAGALQVAALAALAAAGLRRRER